MLLWSGGLDSTALLLRLCKSDGTQGNPVRTLSIMHNMVVASAAESMMRHKIVAKLKRRGYHIKPTEVRIDGATGYNGKHLGQPVIWLPLGVNALDQKEDLYLAYVRGDDIWHYKGELVHAFNYLMAICGKDGALRYPLEWENKTDLAKELRDEHLLSMVWYCETPEPARSLTDFKHRPCGSCRSCLRHKEAIQKIT